MAVSNVDYGRASVDWWCFRWSLYALSANRSAATFISLLRDWIEKHEVSYFRRRFPPSVLISSSVWLCLHYVALALASVLALRFYKAFYLILL